MTTGPTPDMAAAAPSLEDFVTGDNPVVVENRRPGSPNWISEPLARYRAMADVIAYAPDLPFTRPQSYARTANNLGSAPDIATLGNTVPPIGGGRIPTVIAGYASQQSVNRGTSVNLCVSSTVGNFDAEVYRIGWYGGSGAALVAKYSNIPGFARSTPAPNSLGTVACGWPPSVTVDTSNFVSGCFVAAFVPNNGNYASAASYAPFVVREDGRASDILLQVPFATYHAYNPYGGKSLYDYNSGGYNGSINTLGVPARKVSFDRPYQYFAGCGQLFYGDYQVIRWLEREGYDVTYAASLDSDNANLMSNKRMWVSCFHDEYCSGVMRDNMENWLAAGKSAMFLGANSVYWIVRWEDNGRTLVCYKDSTDPVPQPPAPKTTNFFEVYPEEIMFGASYDWYNPYGVKSSWVVANSNHWIYAGTGLTESAQIPNLIGFEWDRHHPAQYALPPNTTLVSNSHVDVSTTRPTQAGLQQAAVRQYPSGAVLFNAATCYWPRFLVGDPTWAADSRVERMTANVLAKAGITPSGTVPSDSTTPRGAAPAAAGSSTAYRQVAPSADGTAPTYYRQPAPPSSSA